MPLETVPEAWTVLPEAWWEGEAEVLDFPNSVSTEVDLHKLGVLMTLLGYYSDKRDKS